jgi:hypothetical protein
MQGRYAQGKESPIKQLNSAWLTETAQNAYLFIFNQPLAHYLLSIIHFPLLTSLSAQQLNPPIPIRPQTTISVFHFKPFIFKYL